MDSSSENPEIQENQRTEQSEYPPLDLPPALFRLSLGLVFLGAVSYFTLNLFRALSNHQSFGEALGGILLDPWATSALVDYLAFVFLS